MQSVMEMTDYFNDNSPKTTRPLVALYCGSRAGNKPIYLEKRFNFLKVWPNMALVWFMAAPVLV